MTPDPDFIDLPGSFWAYVQLVSERLGYSAKRDRASEEVLLRRFSIEEVRECLEQMDLDSEQIVDPRGGPTDLGIRLVDYLNYRAESLEERVAPNLMDREEAQAEFERLREELNPACALPMNKQKGDKQHHAYLVGIVNMLTERALDGRSFVSNPRRLTLATRDQVPLWVGSRWMDVAYPDVIDPVAVWEVKEHYGTTTFGSRVSAAVYETMLDGFEFNKLQISDNRKIYHYLIVDDYFTWWVKGRPYLCRFVDNLHKGLLDEAIFGREILERWPDIVEKWTRSNVR